MGPLSGKISRFHVSHNPIQDKPTHRGGIWGYIKTSFQKSPPRAPETPNGLPQGISLLHLLNAEDQGSNPQYIVLKSADLIKKLGKPDRKNVLGIKRSVEYRTISNLLNQYHEIKLNTDPESVRQLTPVLNDLIKTCLEYQRKRNRRPDREKMIDQVLNQAQNALASIIMQRATQTRPPVRREKRPDCTGTRESLSQQKESVLPKYKKLDKISEMLKPDALSYTRDIHVHRSEREIKKEEFPDAISNQARQQDLKDMMPGFKAFAEEKQAFENSETTNSILRLREISATDLVQRSESQEEEFSDALSHQAWLKPDLKDMMPGFRAFTKERQKPLVENPETSADCELPTEELSLRMGSVTSSIDNFGNCARRELPVEELSLQANSRVSSFEDFVIPEDKLQTEEFSPHMNAGSPFIKYPEISADRQSRAGGGAPHMNAGSPSIKYPEISADRELRAGEGAPHMNAGSPSIKYPEISADRELRAGGFSPHLNTRSPSIRYSEISASRELLAEGYSQRMTSGTPLTDISRRYQAADLACSEARMKRVYAERKLQKVLDENFFNHRSGFAVKAFQDKVPAWGNMAIFQSVTLASSGPVPGVPSYAALSCLDVPVHTIQIRRVRALKHYWEKEVIERLEASNYELRKEVKNPFGYKQPVNLDRLFSIAFDTTGKYSEDLKLQAVDIYEAVDRYAQFRNTLKNFIYMAFVSAIKFCGSTAFTVLSYFPGFDLLKATATCVWGTGFLDPQNIYFSVQAEGRKQVNLSLEEIASKYIIDNNLNVAADTMRDAYEFALDEVEKQNKTHCCVNVGKFDHTRSFVERAFRSFILSRHIASKILNELVIEANKLPGGFREMKDGIGHKKYYSVEKTAQYIYSIGERTIAMSKDIVRMMVNELALIEHIADKHHLSFEEAEIFLKDIAAEQNMIWKRGLRSFLMDDYLWGLLGKHN